MERLETWFEELKDWVVKPKNPVDRVMREMMDVMNTRGQYRLLSDENKKFVDDWAKEINLFGGHLLDLPIKRYNSEVV